VALLVLAVFALLELTHLYRVFNQRLHAGLFPLLDGKQGVLSNLGLNVLHRVCFLSLRHKCVRVLAQGVQAAVSFVENIIDSPLAQQVVL